MTTTLQSIKYRSEVKYMTVWKDSSGAVLQNSANAMFPQPRVEPVSIGIVCAEVFTDTYSDSTYKTQLNAVNNGTWRGWGAGEAWISRIEWNPEANVSSVAGHLLEYEIRLCEYKWTSQYVQCGYVYKSSSTHKTFVDSDGNPYLGFLDGSGAKLSVGGTPVIAEATIKRAISFSGLGF